MTATKTKQPGEISRKQCRLLMERLEREDLGVHSLMVWQRGKILLEHWWAPYTKGKKHTLFSVSKTFNGLAVGFAVQEGYLSLDDRVVSFFPEYLPYPACENMERMTIRHLLTMSTGLEADPHDFYEKRPEDFRDASPCCYHGYQPTLSADWIRNFFHSYVKYRPGTEFVYCTHGSYLLSAIVQKTVGKKTADYLAEKLFQPLGITDYFWETGPDGRTVGGWGLMLKTEDLLKVGIFLLQEGRWQGKQLLNAEWVRSATSSQIPIIGLPGEPNTTGYGYQIWIDRRERAYAMRGAFGQFCLVFPERELVVAVTAGAPDEKAGRILNDIWEELSSSSASKEDDEETNRKNKTQLPRIPWPEGRSSLECETAKRVNGIHFVLADNFLRFRALRFCFGAEDALTLETQEGIFTLPIGFQEWKSGKTCVKTVDTDTDTSILFEHISCAGAWEKDQYHLCLCFDETAYIHDFWIRFPGDGIYLRHQRNCSFIDAVNLTMAGVQAEELLAESES